jgi:hypothetical protein
MNQGGNAAGIQEKESDISKNKIDAIEYDGMFEHHRALVYRLGKFLGLAFGLTRTRDPDSVGTEPHRQRKGCRS